MDKKYKYRFKTEQEFKYIMIQLGRDEYSWRIHFGLNAEGEMDYLLGNDIDVPIDCIFDANVVRDFTINRISQINEEWFIYPKMLIREIIRPEYKPKKFIYE